MNRSKKAFYNGITGLTYEIVGIVCGLILPRLILSAFGSKYNGITQSITQFLSFVVLFKAGVGAVTKAALYKPLAEKNILQISKTIKATEIFMKKVALIFIVCLFSLACLYPFLVKDEFSWIFSFTLVMIIGLSTFAQYYFGITYQMLLEADQSQYIISLISTATIIINVIIASIMIYFGAGIHLVKLGSSLVFALNPIVINLFVKRKYKIKKDVEPDNSAMKQRWDAFAQQVAMMVRDNTDIIILTIFCNTLEVSVYTVYFMIIKSINSIIRAFTNGIGTAFGNMLVKNEKQAMKENLKIYEFLIYSLSTVMYSCTCILITQFVIVYTKGVNDVSYNRPIFGYIMSFAYFFFCIRIPYQNIVEVAGHFKQTKKGAYLEAALNLGISVVLGWQLGIEGVAIGTLVAMIFRTFQYAFYITKHLIDRKNSEFLFKLVVYLICMSLIILICNLLPIRPAEDFLQWFINALIVAFVSVAITLVFDMIFYRKGFISFFRKVQNVIKHKNSN